MNNKDKFNKAKGKLKQWFLLDLIIIMTYIIGFYTIITYNIIVGCGVVMIGTVFQCMKYNEMSKIQK
jgi:hypothetical protein